MRLRPETGNALPLDPQIGDAVEPLGRIDDPAIGDAQDVHVFATLVWTRSGWTEGET